MASQSSASFAPPPLSDLPFWQRLGGARTAAEIGPQPALWEELAQSLRQVSEGLHGFLDACLDNSAQRVLFTGAGSSGFTAEMATDTLATRWPAKVHAVHTTSLLTHPAHYLQTDHPTLLISFGRSGSSPESIVVVDQVRAFVPGARFVNITCNTDGELMRRGASRADTHTVLMPPVATKALQ